MEAKRRAARCPASFFDWLTGLILLLAGLWGGAACWALGGAYRAQFYVL